MSRKLLALNLALVALIALTGWRLWSAMNQADAREEAVLGRPLEESVARPFTPVEPPEGLRGADYFEVAGRLLFSPDRNPDVVIQAAPPKPLPPMPVAYGVLDLGSGPTIILSDRSGKGQRGYRVGDVYEEFEIVEITDTGVTFGWEGELVGRTLEELMPEADEAPAPAPTKTAAAKPKPEPAKTGVLGEANKAEPGDIDMGGGIKSCRQGDDSPSGTVAGGYKKIVSRTPFGRVCRWEPVQ